MLLIVVIVAVLAAVATGVIVFRPAGDQSADPARSATPTRTPSRAPDAAPTGCLGGSNRDNAMVLAAQKAAPHTSAGAVEVAAAIQRWLNRYPTPTPEEADTIEPDLLASGAKAGLSAQLAGSPNLSGGLIPDGTPFYVSTIRGVWTVESYSTSRVTVSLGLPYVVDGALSSSLAASSTVTLAWERGAWRYETAAKARPVSEIFDSGAKFTGGC